MNTRYKIAIHYHDDAHQDSFARRWIAECRNRDTDVLAIDFRQSDIIKKISDCDGAMWHWFHLPDDKQVAPKVLQAIESGLKIPVFPNLATRWHYDDKLAQHYLFEAIKAPKINSWVFWNYEAARCFIKECQYPIVFKLSVGAGSANVLKFDSRAEAEQVLEQIFGPGFFPYTVNEFASQNDKVEQPAIQKGIRNRIRRMMQGKVVSEHQVASIPWYYLVQKNYAYFQEFLPGNPYDIRITVIGNRAFGFIRHNRPNDFRASGSGSLDYDLNKIPPEAVRIAHQISEENGFQSMAYDFLYDHDRRILLNEISYCYVNKAISNCPGFWDRQLVWHAGQIHPEMAQVEDFLYYIETGKLK